MKTILKYLLALCVSTASLLAEDFPSYCQGAEFDGTTTTFRLFAPSAKKVTVWLTSSGKVGDRLEMTMGSDGVWQVATAKAPPGSGYLYSVVDCRGGTKRRTDPFSFTTRGYGKGKCESVVVDLNAYRWLDAGWLMKREGQDPLKQPLSIYELQLKSWKQGYADHFSFKNVTEALVAYCKKMNFTHVELYALFDHMNPAERGYQVENYFAPYHLLGSCDEVKQMIDRLHQEGIGVIVDWVFAHFHHTSESHDYSSSLYEIDGTNLVGREKTDWGTLFFDYTKPETRRLMQASALYWLDVMHVDGFRFDAVHSMLVQNDVLQQAPLAFVKDLQQLVHTSYPGVLMIAEYMGDLPGLTKPVAAGGVGFDLKWGISLNKESEQYFHRPSSERAKSEVHDKFTSFLKELQTSEKEIFTQSHDDADTCGEHPGSTLYNLLPDSNRFANMRNYFAWQILGPNRGHLIHMGDELGQQISWFERFQKRLPSVDWDLEKKDENKKLQRCISDLIAFYRANADFWLDGEMGFTQLYDDASACALAYLRGDLLVIHNFSDKPLTAPDFVQKKQVAPLFNTDSKLYGGSGKYENGRTIAPNSTRVYKTSD